MSGAALEVVEDGPGLRYLSDLWVPEEIRRMGIATKLLEQACADADRDDVALHLIVAPDGIPRDVLTRLYRRFGFEFLGDATVTMTRLRRSVREPVLEAAA